MLKRLLSASLFVLGIASAQTAMKRDLGCTPASASGTAYTCSISPAPAALVTNETYYFVADVANTAAATINFNSLGAKTIKKVTGGITTSIIANDIRAGQIVELRYDGTNMQMVSPVGNTLAQTIASGTAALGTSAIASGACATVVTVSATGTATTDIIVFTPNADITAVTGYAPATTGGLAVYPYPSADNVNFKACNPTSSSITPGAVTLNWRVAR
jgi:hypothetical protein